MVRSKQKKRRNSLNFGEIKSTKVVAITSTRGQAKAGKAVKVVVLCALALQAISSIVEAIAKMIRLFISQCITKSQRDFLYRFVIDGPIANEWQNKCICRFRVLLSFL